MISCWREVGLLSLAAALSLLTYFLLPDDLGEPGKRASAIAVLAAILWAVEVVPLFVTSLVVVALKIILLVGLMGADGKPIHFSPFLESFGSSTIILFLGGFLLAAAAGKHGLDTAIAMRLLRPFLTKPVPLVIAITFIGGLVGMWMSNTATAALMLAMAAPMLRDPKIDGRLASAIALACAFGPSLGSFATPIATPPNAIAMALLREQGIDISFLRWMLFGVPLSLGMLVVACVIICLVTRPGGTTGLEPTSQPPPLNWKGWATALAMGVAILGWLTRPLHGMDDCVPALLAACLLGILGLLDERDLRHIEWSILILIWGGLALGQGLVSTGVLEYVSQLSWFQHTGIALAAVVAFLGILLSTFLSNTAAANLLVPLAIGLSAAGDPRLAIVACFSVNFALALPISSPPNALAFATGKITSRQLIVAGGLISLIGLGAMLAGYQWILPLTLNVGD